MFDVNKFAVNQDYEFASELIQALEKNIPREDPELIRKKLFYFEGIFLDLTDRTGAHPTVPFAHEDRGGVMQDFVKFLGFGNRKIVWEFNELFNEDDYFANEWTGKLVFSNHVFASTGAREFLGLGPEALSLPQQVAGEGMSAA